MDSDRDDGGQFFSNSIIVLYMAENECTESRDFFSGGIFLYDCGLFFSFPQTDHVYQLYAVIISGTHTGRAYDEKKEYAVLLHDSDRNLFSELLLFHFLFYRSVHLLVSED